MSQEEAVRFTHAEAGFSSTRLSSLGFKFVSGRGGVPTPQTPTSEAEMTSAGSAVEPPPTAVCRMSEAP